MMWGFKKKFKSLAKIQLLVIPLKRDKKDVFLCCLLTSIRMYNTAVLSREYLLIYLNELPGEVPKTSLVCIF